MAGVALPHGREETGSRPGQAGDDAELFVRAGRNRGYSVPVHDDISVGRDSSCALQLFDEGVSRLHFRIVHEAPLYYVEDLGSTNGTWVNLERVQRHIVYHRDEIACGSATLQFLCRSCLNPKRTAVELAVVLTGDEPDEIDQPMDTAMLQLGLRDAAGMNAGGSPPAERLLATCGLIQRIVRKTGWQDLYALLLEGLPEVIPHERAVYCRFNPATQRALPVACRRSPHDPPGTRLVIDRELIERSCGEAHCIARRLPSGRWALAAPMFGTDRPRGAVYLEIDGDLDPKQALGILGAVSRQAGLMLEQEDLLAKIRHQKLQVEEARSEAESAAWRADTERNRLETMLHSLSDGALITDHDGEVLSANLAGRRCLGQLARLDEAGRLEAIGEISFARIRAGLTEGKPRETWQVVEGDPPCHYAVTAFRMPLPTEPGSPVRAAWGLGILVHDETRRKLAEAALGLTEEQLRQAQRMGTTLEIGGGIDERREVP